MLGSASRLRAGAIHKSCFAALVLFMYSLGNDGTCRQHQGVSGVDTKARSAALEEWLLFCVCLSD